MSRSKSGKAGKDSGTRDQRKSWWTDKKAKDQAALDDYQAMFGKGRDSTSDHYRTEIETSDRALRLLGS